jgi:nicotinate-nucleotide adenylyltransferase
VKIGILGGTFDPIHIGHLVVAEEARIGLGLDEVLFVPAGQPWLKQDRDISPAADRVEMVRRAIADNPHFRLCTLEVERPGLTYTVDTLAALHKQAGRGASFFLILGRDAMADFPVWKEAETVLQLCSLVVAPRFVPKDVQAARSNDLRHREEAPHGLMDRVIQLDMPVIGISSSDIRRRVAQGLSIRYLVPHGVATYIAEHHMYVASLREA